MVTVGVEDEALRTVKDREALAVVVDEIDGKQVVGQDKDLVVEGNDDDGVVVVCGGG